MGYNSGARESVRLWWLWCLVSTRASWFVVHLSRGMTAAGDVLGEFVGTLVTDDYSGYNRVPPERRQLFRVGRDVAAPAPRRPGRARLTHPVPHEAASLVDVV